MIIPTLAAFAAMSCPLTEMQNVTKQDWNAFDMQILEQAKHHCPKWDFEYPCVKLFRKYGDKQYSVVCGKKKK